MKTSFGQGKYYYFREHSFEGGWGVKRGEEGLLIGLFYDKNYAALTAELLNTYKDEGGFLKDLEDLSKKRKKKISE